MNAKNSLHDERGGLTFNPLARHGGNFLRHFSLKHARQFVPSGVFVLPTSILLEQVLLLQPHHNRPRSPPPPRMKNGPKKLLLVLRHHNPKKLLLVMEATPTYVFMRPWHLVSQDRDLRLL